MKELLLTPIAIALILGTLTQLEDLAMQTQERTVQFAEDAVLALDCAYEARPLTDCSENILSADFAKEVQQTQDILAQLQEQTAVN